MKENLRCWKLDVRLITSTWLIWPPICISSSSSLPSIFGELPHLRQKIIELFWWKLVVVYLMSTYILLLRFYYRCYFSVMIWAFWFDSHLPWCLPKGWLFGITHLCLRKGWAEPKSFSLVHKQLNLWITFVIFQWIYTFSRSPNNYIMLFEHSLKLMKYGWVMNSYLHCRIVNDWNLTLVRYINQPGLLKCLDDIDVTFIISC